eukprot:1926527-Rhodomonas_salina.3
MSVSGKKAMCANQVHGLGFHLRTVRCDRTRVRVQDGNSPVFCAVYQGHPEVVDRLIAAKCDVNSKNPEVRPHDAGNVFNDQWSFCPSKPASRFIRSYSCAGFQPSVPSRRTGTSFDSKGSCGGWRKAMKVRR